MLVHAFLTLRLATNSRLVQKGGKKLRWLSCIEYGFFVSVRFPACLEKFDITDFHPNTFTYKKIRKSIFYIEFKYIQLRAKQTAPLVDKHYENEVNLRQQS